VKRRFTFNANLSEIGDFEKFLRTLIAWQPEWVVLMNGIGGNEYRRVRETMNTWGGKIIYRHYEESDGHLWRSRKADEHVNLLKSLHAIDPKAWFIVSNEPLPGDDERGDMQKFHADVIKGAVEHGIRLCVGNLGIAAMGDKKDVDGGRWDVLLKAIGERANLKAEGVCQIMLGIHTYTHAIAPLHCAGKDPRDMTNPAKAAIWPTKEEINTTPEDNWLVFRGDWYVQRIRALTGNQVDVADTECTKDRMPNIVLQFAATVTEIDRLAKREVRGLPTLPEFYKVVFPQWTPAQAECEQMLWWEGVHPAYYRCFALFCWNHNKLWKRDYDLSGMDDFLTLWPIYKLEDEPQPEPQPAPKSGLVFIGSTAIAVNIRNSKNAMVTDNIIGQLHLSDEVTVHSYADGWFDIERLGYGNVPTKRGFVSDQQGRVFIKSQKAAEPVPVPEGYELIKSSDLAALRADFDELKANLANHAEWRMAVQSAYNEVGEAKVKLHQRMNEDLKETA
jgi:hypothetical protein